MTKKTPKTAIPEHDTRQLDGGQPNYALRRDGARPLIRWLTQQLIEPVAELVLVIGFCQPRQVELRALGQVRVAGGEQDRQRGGANRREAGASSMPVMPGIT